MDGSIFQGFIDWIGRTFQSILDAIAFIGDSLASTYEAGIIIGQKLVELPGYISSAMAFFPVEIAGLVGIVIGSAIALSLIRWIT